MNQVTQFVIPSGERFNIDPNGNLTGLYDRPAGNINDYKTAEGPGGKEIWNAYQAALGLQAPSTGLYNPNPDGSSPVAGNNANGTPIQAPTPTIPSTITSANLTPTNLPPIPTAPPPASTAGLTAGATSYITSQTQPTVQQTPQDTTYTDGSKALLNEIQGLYSQDTGKAAFTQSALDSSGATALDAKQKELAAKITALNINDQAIPLQMEQGATGKGITSGILDRQTQESRRQNAIAALSIQAEYAVNSGQLATAQQAAQRAVDLRYADIEQQIAQKTQMLQLYAPFMSAEQQKIAQAQANQLNAQNTALASNKQLQIDMINYAQAQGNTAIMSQLLALDPSSSNFKAQLGGLAGQVTPKAQGASTTYTDEGGRRYAVTLDAQGNVINKADIGASSNAGTTSVTVEDSTGKYVVTLDAQGKQLNKVKIAEATPTSASSGVTEVSAGASLITKDPVTGAYKVAITAPTAAQTTASQSSGGYTQAEIDQLKANQDAAAKLGITIPGVSAGATASTPVTSKPMISGSLTYTSQDIGQGQQLLEQSRGSDNWVDPNIYLQMYQKWVGAGGLLQDFLSKYPPKNYVNPKNSWLPSFLMPGGKSGGTTTSSSGGITA